MEPSNSVSTSEKIYAFFKGLYANPQDRNFLDRIFFAIGLTLIIALGVEVNRSRFIPLPANTSSIATNRDVAPILPPSGTLYRFISQAGKTIYETSPDGMASSSEYLAPRVIAFLHSRPAAGGNNWTFSEVRRFSDRIVKNYTIVAVKGVLKESGHSDNIVSLFYLGSTPSNNGGMVVEGVDTVSESTEGREAVDSLWKRCPPL